ncbi:RDD family protein [Geodermatophilus sp. SYSU D01045]
MTRAEERRGTHAGIPAPRPAPAAEGAGPAEGAGRGSRAGLVTRALANVVDLLLVALLVVGGYAAVAAARFLPGPASFSFPAPSSSTLLAWALGVQAVYFAVTWADAGRTYGDRLLGLRVGDDRGDRLGWGRSAVRAVLCVAFPVGLLWVLVSRGNRSVQDLVLRTSVVYDRPPPVVVPGGR